MTSVHSFFSSQLEVIRAVAQLAATRIRNMDRFNRWIVAVIHRSLNKLKELDWLNRLNPDGSAPKTPTTGVRRTPSFQRPDSSGRNRPGSSSTLPRKSSAAPESSVRARNPSGSSAGMSHSPSGPLSAVNRWVTTLLAIQSVSLTIAQLANALTEGWCGER